MTAAMVIAASTSLLAGCGDNIAETTCTVDHLTEPMAPLASPNELPEDNCEDGDLTAFDPSGLWYVEVDTPSFFGGPGPMHFSLTCPELAVQGSLGTGRVEFDRVVLDDNTLYWRAHREFTGNFTLTDAIKMCKRTGGSDDRLQGYYTRCTNFDGNKACDTQRATMTRHNRIAGEQDSQGLTLLSEFRGGDNPWPESFSANVRVEGDFAYVVNARDGLRIVNVSDPANPVEVGFYPASADYFNDVKVIVTGDSRTYALIASGLAGVLVINVTDPTTPILASVFTPTGNPDHGVHTVFLDTVGPLTRAYLADGFSNMMAIYDITEPEAPTPIGRYTAPNTDWAFHDLYVEAGRAYINATVGGMLIVDTQDDPANPTFVGRFESDDYSHSNWVTRVDGRLVSVHGGEGYDAHTKVVDVDPASATFAKVLGEYQTRATVSVHNIVAIENRAYIAHYEDGIRVLDISDPAAPHQIAYFNSWRSSSSRGGRFEGTAGLDVDVDSKLIYATDSQRGLLILRID